MSASRFSFYMARTIRRPWFNKPAAGRIMEESTSSSSSPVLSPLTRSVGCDHLFAPPTPVCSKGGTTAGAA